LGHENAPRLACVGRAGRRYRSLALAAASEPLLQKALRFVGAIGVRPKKILVGRLTVGTVA
jgi:hypothetical protein